MRPVNQASVDPGGAKVRKGLSNPALVDPGGAKLWKLSTRLASFKLIYISQDNDKIDEIYKKTYINYIQCSKFDLNHFLYGFLHQLYKKLLYCIEKKINQKKIAHKVHKAMHKAKTRKTKVHKVWEIGACTRCTRQHSSTFALCRGLCAPCAAIRS